MNNFKNVIQDISYGTLKKSVVGIGGKWFENAYDLNLGGIRNSSTESGAFDDIIYLAFRNQFGNPIVSLFHATTDPSKHFLNKPINTKGAAILVHDKQYRGVYQPGYHGKSRQWALRQISQMDYWRDDNKDDTLDMNSPIFSEIAYTNLHHSGNNIVRKIGVWGAGCQVVQDKNALAYIMKCVFLQKKFIGSNVVSYTLLSESTIRKSL